MCRQITQISNVQDLTHLGVKRFAKGHTNKAVTIGQHLWAIVDPTSNERIASTFRWGFDGWIPNAPLIPFARIERMEDPRLWGPAWKSSRAIIPAISFHEKQIAVCTGMIGIGAIYEFNEKQERSIAVITVPANATLSPIHNRMPLVLRLDHIGDWLTRPDLSVQEALSLQTFPEDTILIGQ